MSVNHLPRDLFDRMIFEAGFEVEYDFDLREAYSGRGMYSRECFGLVPNGHSMIAFLIALTKGAAVVNEEIESEDLSDEAREAWDAWWHEGIADVATDSMGRDEIVYWPGWQIAAATTNEG